MEKVLILNEQSAWLYPSILTDSFKMDYPFQITCVQPPPPLRKKSEKGCLWERGRLCTGQSQTDNLFLVWKRPITKFPCPVFLMIAKEHVPKLNLIFQSSISCKNGWFWSYFLQKNTRNLVKNDLFALNFETVERFSSQFNFDCLHFAKYCIIALG